MYVVVMSHFVYGGGCLLADHALAIKSCASASSFFGDATCAEVEWPGSFALNRSAVDLSATVSSTALARWHQCQGHVYHDVYNAESAIYISDTTRRWCF